MRYGQLVVGPAGSGKSSYCSTIVKHCEDIGRQVNVVNLDPAAEYFDYTPFIDIRELIGLDDVMLDEDLKFGPNGGLVFCLEYLVSNLNWLDDQLGEDSDDYILFDCPGQIELFTHLDVMRKLVDHLQFNNFYICGVHLLDSKFMIEPSMFISGIMTALSTMFSLRIPHVNVLSKFDLLSKSAKKSIERFLEPDAHHLLEGGRNSIGSRKLKKKYAKLNKAIAGLIDNYSMVKFMPLDREDPESVSDLLVIIDNAIQYGETLDVKVKYPDEEDDDED